MKLLALPAACLWLLSTPLMAQELAPPKLDPARLRPVAHKIVDCPVPPTALPGDVARWAVIYCTEGDGQLFAYRDGYYGIFPGTVKRFIVNASGFGGGEDEPKRGENFAAVTIDPFSKDDLASWSPGKNRVPGFLAQATKIYMLTLKIDNGQETQMLISDPETDPFWVQPVREHHFFGQAFYMASLAFLEKGQQQ